MFVRLFVRWFVILVVVLFYFCFRAFLRSRSTFIHLLASFIFLSIFSAMLSLSLALYLFAIPLSFLYILFYLPCCCLVLCEHSVEIYIAHIGIIITLISTAVRFFVVSHNTSVVHTVHFSALYSVDDDCTFHPEFNATQNVYIYPLLLAWWLHNTSQHSRTLALSRSLNKV